MSVIRDYLLARPLRRESDDFALAKLSRWTIAGAFGVFVLLSYALIALIVELRQAEEGVSTALGILVLLGWLAEIALAVFLFFCLLFRFLPWWERIEERAAARMEERWRQKRSSG